LHDYNSKEPRNAGSIRLTNTRWKQQGKDLEEENYKKGTKTKKLKQPMLCQ